MGEGWGFRAVPQTRWESEAFRIGTGLGKGPVKDPIGGDK